MIRVICGYGVWDVYGTCMGHFIWDIRIYVRILRIRIRNSCSRYESGDFVVLLASFRHDQSSGSRNDRATEEAARVANREAMRRRRRGDGLRGERRTANGEKGEMETK